MASSSSYISVVVTAIVTILPFYGLVAKLTHLNDRSLEPCTDSNPCQWTQLFDASTKPRTYPITVQVRSNVTRPLMIATDRSAGTVALYNKPVARAEMIFPTGVVAGGFLFEAPSSNNISQLTTRFAVCYLGVCMDNEFHFSLFYFLGSSLSGSYEWVKDATDVWSSEVAVYLKQHHETRQAVDDITAALKTCRLSALGNLAWFIFVPLKNAYVLIYTFWANYSRPDLLPSPRCDQFSPEKMTEVCATDEQRNKVDNSLANQQSTKIFLASVVGWAVTSAAHDVILLMGYTEAVTLVVGAASVACQGIAVGAGFLAALGATEVFIAPLTSTNGEPCACYYKMDSTVALLLMSTPAILLYKYVGKKKLLLQAFVNGDCLYNVRFSVPFHIVRQNKGWPTHSLLLPTLVAPEAKNSKETAPEPRARFSTVGFKIASRAVKGTTRLMSILCCTLPVCLAGSSIFATAMGIMMEQARRTHGVLSWMIAFLTTCPCLLVVGSMVQGVADHWHEICELIKLLMQGSSMDDARSRFSSRRGQPTPFSRVAPALAPIWQGVLLCPLICPWFMFTDKVPSPSEKFVIYTYWEVGGFLFVLFGLRIMNSFLGFTWADIAFDACITPPVENFEAWKADRPGMVDILDITTPRALRKRLLEESSCPSAADQEDSN